MQRFHDRSNVYSGHVLSESESVQASLLIGLLMNGSLPIGAHYN